MKNGSVFLAFLLLVACSSPEKTKSVSSNLAVDTKDELKSEKATDSTYLNSLKAERMSLSLMRDQNELMGERWVSVSNKEELILVDNEEPDSIVITYIMLRDRADNIRLISEFPVNETGDWEIQYDHYFDEEGQTFAFVRKTNFFNSGCSEELVDEQIEEYYGPEFNRLERFYSLRDSKNTLSPNDCQLNYDFPYEVVNHLEHYLNRINYQD